MSKVVRSICHLFHRRGEPYIETIKYPNEGSVAYSGAVRPEMCRAKRSAKCIRICWNSEVISHVPTRHSYNFQSRKLRPTGILHFHFETEQSHHVRG